MIVLLLLSVVFGGWGGSRYGYYGWSPFGLLLVVLVLWLLFGGGL